MQTRFRNAFILVGVLIVLIIVATWGERARKQRRNPGEPLYPGLQTEEIQRIVINKDTTRVELTRDGDNGWLVASEGNYAADPSLVDKILEAIPKFHTRDLVSQNPDKQETFEVTDSLGTEVLLEGSGDVELGHFYVGKQGPDFMSSYVRPAGDKKVLLVPVYLKSTFDTRRDSWRDKSIFKFDQDDVIRAELLPAEGDTLTLAKGEDDKWSIVEPDSIPVKESIWTSTLRVASNLRCDAFPDSLPNPTDVGLDPPMQLFKVEMADGRREVLKIGDTDDKKRHYVMKEGDDTLFLLSAGRVSSLMRNLETLRETPPAVGPEPPAEG